MSQIVNFLCRKENLYLDIFQFGVGYLVSRTYLKELNPFLLGSALVVQVVTWQIFQFYEKSHFENPPDGFIQKHFKIIKSYSFVVHVANFIITNQIFRFSCLHTSAFIALRVSAQHVYECFESDQNYNFRYNNNQSV